MELKSSPAIPGSTRVVVALGATQTLAWASSYYLPAILAEPIARGVNVPETHVLAAFSCALVLSALIAPKVGRVIDRAGGRGVLCASNVVLAAGLVLLAGAQGTVTLAIAWGALGIGMGMGLYDAAFAALARIYGTAARAPITGITLFAGFASTLGWPLTAAIESEWGWRSACLTWSAIHLFVCLPLNRYCLPASASHVRVAILRPEKTSTVADQSSVMWLLAFVFAAAWFVTGAMATHLPSLLREAGATTAQAIGFAALVGPSQVAARLAEFGLLRHIHPIVSARIAAAMLPLGVGMLVIFGMPYGLAAFAILYGAGNGLLTIAKGTLPLAMLGPKDYGYRQGLIGAPARMAQATAPLLFGLLVSRWGIWSLAAAVTLTLSALIALLILRPQHQATS
jgi:MFS family permease